MKKSLLCTICIIILLLSCFYNFAYAANDTYSTLLILESDIVDGQVVSAQTNAASNSKLNVSLVTVLPNESLVQKIQESVGDTKYDKVIIQPSFKRLTEQFDDVKMAVELLGQSSSVDESAQKSEIFISTPWKELTTAEENAVKGKTKSLEGKIINTYSSLIGVQSRNIKVIDQSNLTTEGSLTVSVSYSRALLNNTEITGLTSYPQVKDEDVKTIVDVVNKNTNLVSNQVTSSGSAEKTSVVSDKSSSSTKTSSTTTTSETSKSSKKKNKSSKKKANVKKIKMPKHASLARDAEPRIFFTRNNPDYIYIDLKDKKGILCEYTKDSVKNYKKENRPRLYVKKDNKYVELSDSKIKRSTQEEYEETGKKGAYTYRIAIPKESIKDKKTQYYITASDISVYKNYVKEWFEIKKYSEEKYVINRAPRIREKTLVKENNKIGFYAENDGGVVKVIVGTLPKAKSINPKKHINVGTVLGEWNGAVQKNWAGISKVAPKSGLVDKGLTKLTKFSKFFNTKGEGLSPAIKDKKGWYQVYIVATDPSGMRLEKSVTINTNQYYSVKEGKYVDNDEVKKEKEERNKKEEPSESSEDDGDYEGGGSSSNSGDSPFIATDGSEENTNLVYPIFDGCSPHLENGVRENYNIIRDNNGGWIPVGV